MDGILDGFLPGLATKNTKYQRKKLIFQQDNDRKHVAKPTME